MEREARKRRIVDRGSDRFALITGRIHNLEETGLQPLTPISPYPANANNYQQHEHHHHHPSPRQPHLDLGGEDDLSLKYQLNDRIRGDDALMFKKTEADNCQHDQRNAEAMQASAATHKSGAESSVVDTRILSTKASDDTEMLLKPGALRSRFTAKMINSCILSSEDARIFCSIMIAFLVVIAYANLPRHIVKSKSLIASRPLYVLLLTDVIIVILRVTSTKRKDSGGKDMKLKQDINFQEGEHIDWDGAIKVLEWGLVLYQTVRAIFIDCSFYVVIVICGFAFM